MVKTDTSLRNLSFQKQQESDTLTDDAIELIKRMHRHILKNNCVHCRHVLNGDNDKDEEAGYQPASDFAGNNTHNPTGQSGSEYYNE